MSKKKLKKRSACPPLALDDKPTARDAKPTARDDKEPRTIRAARCCALAALFFSAFLYPLEIADGPLERVIGSSLLESGDIPDWTVFCRALAADAQRPATPASRLWPLLDPASRRLIENGAADQTSLTEQRQTRLIRALNGALVRADFYEPAAFSNTFLPKKAERLLESAQAAGPALDYREIRRLNRELFQAAWPEALATPSLVAEDLPGGETISSILRPYLQFEISPLPLKETVTSLALLLSIMLYGSWLLSRDRFPGQRQPFPREFLVWIAFLIWALSSTVRAPHFLRDSGCAETAYSLAIWGVFVLTLLGLPASRRFERWVARSVVGAGFLIMLLSAGEATRPVAPYLFKFLNDFAGPYSRNLYGSLIGHNTGVAALGVGPFFFLLGWFIAARRPLRRVALGLALLVCLYCFAVTKSRFVWLVLPVLTAFFLYGLRRQIGYRPRPLHLAAGGLILLALAATQLLPRSTEDAARFERADYIARIKSLRPSILLQGTRARIVAVSASLVADRSLIGHGLGAFTVVYPEAQASFFERHPDTPLMPTEALTQRAHNDYLQLLIETGLVGLGLALAAFVLLARRGLGRLRRLEAASEPRLDRYCALFGVVSIALHALIDFPFHLAPLATFFIFQLYLFYGNRAEDPPIVLPERPLDTLWRRPLIRIARFALIATLWLSLAPAAAWQIQRLRADHHYKLGSNHMEFKMARLARDAFDACLRHDPLHFDARLHKAICHTVLAREYLEKSPRQAEVYLQNAFEDLRAVTHMARAEDNTVPFGPRLNHAIHDGLSQAWDIRRQLVLTDVPESTKRALDHRRQALRHAPSVARFAMDLFYRLSPNAPEHQEERKHCLRLLDRYNRDLLTKEYLARAERLQREEMSEWAEKDLAELLSAVSDPLLYEDIHIALAQSQLASGRLEAFRATLDLMRSRFADSPNLPVLEIVDLARRGQYAEAERSLKLILDKQSPPNAYWQYVYSQLLEAQGGEKATEGQAVARQLIRASSHPSQSYALRAKARRDIFGDAPGAALHAQTAHSYFPRLVSTLDSLALLRAQAAQGDRAALARTLRLTREGEAISPTLARLHAELSKNLNK